MPVFQLSDKLVFPSPELADEDGLVAVGGDLSEERILLAYSMGIFPWYSEGSQILWWSPDPRLVLIPSEIKISRSLRQTLKKNIYRTTVNTAFPEVIRNCATVNREKHGGTWLTGRMVEAYIRLHRLGYAHSIESWYGDELSGGLYGVAIGRVFFGESMFSRRNDASKIALIKLAQTVAAEGFEIIDCQMVTRHLMSLGARPISRNEFMTILKHALGTAAKTTGWQMTKS